MSLYEATIVLFALLHTVLYWFKSKRTSFENITYIGFKVRAAIQLYIIYDVTSHVGWPSW